MPSRPVVAVVASVLLAALLGCRGDAARPGAAASSAADGPTTEQFCDAYSPWPADVRPSEDWLTVWKRNAARLGRVGVPADAPPEVRRGLEVLVAASRAVPDGVEDPEDARIPRLSPADDDAVLAFDLWASDACGLPSPVD